MMRFTLLSFFLIFSGVVFSQSISGKLTDAADNKPLQGATLSLSDVNDSLSVRKVVSDQTGAFRFSGLSLGSYYLAVSSIGYEEFKQVVTLTDSVPNADIKTLAIPKGTVQLGGVTVLAKAAPVIQKGDTTQFSASQYKVNPDATTEDLIKKLPGVTVDRDGTVTAQGEQVRKVTIDGKDFFGDDASAALRNLPCDQPDLEVHAPLLELEPWQVVDLGFQVSAPFEKTWSCGEDAGEPCWACRGCRAREAAFQQAGKPDPLRGGRKV